MLHRNIADGTPGISPMAQSVVAPHGSEVPVNGNGEARSHAGFWALTLGSLGVVYGDIGTSPLYAFREAVVAAGGPGGLVTRGSVLGVLSLILWALILVVTIKYVLILLRADNNGEGGTLTLMALALRAVGGSGSVVVLLGIISGALFYGDALITPALSVLSAIEGLKVATPAFEPYVVPLTIVILLALFAVQSRGTGRVGALFGPITTVWFIAIAVPAVHWIAADPEVLSAFNPMHGLTFLGSHGKIGLLTLGAVFLAVTGAEALYADLGHFGHRAIQIAWFTVALPCLLLNYFGQGALLLRDPAAAENPFYHLAPAWALYPLIGLATAATIIASQAVISGAFSLTHQAVQLGYSPRLRIEHTSSREIGQIYVPAVNWGLMLLTCALVLGFRTSSNIAGAYGVALSTLMLMTTLMFYVMSREVWGWSFLRAASVAGLFLWLDLLFFGANALKIRYGGWVPLVIAAAVFTLMTTWKRGREILAKRLLEKTVPLKMLLADLAAEPPLRVPGTAVFMSGTTDGTPPALVHNLAHNKVLHEKIVFLHVVTQDVPHVAPGERVTVKRIGKGFHTVTATYGFMDDPNIEDVLAACRVQALEIRIEGATFFLGRETLVTSERPGMAVWRETLFAFMSRNALRATAYFKIPANQVFEVGAQVEL
jgi:KUP system potassium uptake protein